MRREIKGDQYQIMGENDCHSLLFFAFKSLGKERHDMSKLERDFQSHLIKRLKLMFEGCIVMKTDPTYIQGLPDLLILFNDKWASLEIKRSMKAHKQPNQEYYVRLMNDMSFSRFVCPENEEDVLYELQQMFFA